MRLCLFITIILVSQAKSLSAQQLTIAFAQYSEVQTGSRVYAGNKEAGIVTNIKRGQRDTIYVTLEVSKKIKIPKGSLFYLEQKLLSSNRIMIKLAKGTELINFKEIQTGIYRPLKTMSQSEADSSLSKLKLN